MSREPVSVTPSYSATTFDVVVGLCTAAMAATLAIIVFTVREAFGLRQPGPRIKCVR